MAWIDKAKKNTVNNNQLLVAVHATAAIKQLQTDNINAIILISMEETARYIGILLTPVQQRSLAFSSGFLGPSGSNERKKIIQKIGNCKKLEKIFRMFMYIKPQFCLTRIFF